MLYTIFKLNKNYNLKYFKFFIFIYFIFYLIILNRNLKKNNKRIGVISCNHHANIGNNLVKYAMFIILSKYGNKPEIIGTNRGKFKLSFLKKNVNFRIVNNFSEIKQKDYDILIVNSDQSWRKWNNDFYDIAFLKFAKFWNIKKFTYAVSLGFNKWKYSKEDEKIAKQLLKNFTGISVREKNSVTLIKKNLGINSIFVLDPTLLIDKKYYLKIIKKYTNSYINDNYIFTYKVTFAKRSKYFFLMEGLIKNASRIFNYKIFNVNLYEKDSVEKFLYGIYYSKAVITNSFHATIFSIIFKKPFISFRTNDDERLNSLRESLDLKTRIIEYNKKPDIDLLNKPLYFNKFKFNFFKKISIKYLKNNLNK